MSETDFRFTTFPSNFKNNLCVLPLGSVFGEIEVVVHNKPYDSFAREELSYFHFAAMDVFVMIDELSAEFVGSTFNFLRPPATDIGDGVEDFFRALLYRKCSGEILVCHDFRSNANTSGWVLPVVISLRKLPLTSMLHAFEQVP